MIVSVKLGVAIKKTATLKTNGLLLKAATFKFSENP